jgi:uncharacterized protein (TIGR03437 family)
MFKRLSTVLILCAVSGSAQTIFPSGTVNAADYTRAFAPGAIIAIFGTNLATSTATATTFPMLGTLGGATVKLSIGGSAVSDTTPIFYASSGQVNAQLPFSLTAGSYTLQIVTSAGTSNSDTITVAAQAPKFFTQNYSGTGTAVATTPQFQLLTSANPARPAANIILWMNSLGPVTGTAVAGQPAPGLNGTQPLSLTTTPTVTINGTAGTVLFAGLVPGLSGLYQVNVTSPLIGITGPLAIQVSAGGATTQTAVTVPYQQLGFYYTLLGGNPVTGQSITGKSAVALRQSDQVTWGPTGYNAWANLTSLTNLPSTFSTVPGLAVTLKNGTSIVYDNNGIESNSAGTFYNNTGGGADSQKPGLTEIYSMSNYFPSVGAGYFKLAQSTTITEMIGYFDAMENPASIFDPANPYIKYRMDIWSSNSSSLPTDTSNYVGNIFTSDTTAGTFTYSATSVQMISGVSTNVPKSIYRLDYKLAAPLTLPAGEYWFSHDASTRATPASSSTAASVPVSRLQQHISGQSVEKGSYLINFYGQTMRFEPSWQLNEPIELRPTSLVDTHEQQ